METRQLKSRTRDPPANGGISYRAKQDVFRLGKQEHRITCGDPKWGWPKQIKPPLHFGFFRPPGWQAFNATKQQSPRLLPKSVLLREEPAPLPPTAGYSTGLNRMFSVWESRNTGLPAVILSGGSQNKASLVSLRLFSPPRLASFQRYKTTKPLAVAEECAFARGTCAPPANGGIFYRAKQDVFRLGKQEHRITCGDPKWG